VTTDHFPGTDAQIADLLKRAGRRPTPDTSRVAQARDAARLEWKRALRASRWRRLWRAGVVAASLTVVWGTVVLWTRSPAPTVTRPEIATVRTIAGAVRITDADHRQSNGAQTPIRSFRAGDEVNVPTDGRLAVLLLEGTSVRMAGGAVVVFESRDRIVLVRGAVYVDVEPARHQDHLVVDTPFGAVRHEGTQFQLRLNEKSLDVRVREGTVTVDAKEGRLRSTAGEALVIASDRPVERRRIPTSGAEWAWITAMAPRFTLEGATVSSFLTWVCREQGWQWEYTDAPAKRRGERAVLHGSIDGLTPEDAVRAVLPAAGLAATRDGDKLIVSATGR
jgi:FecR protein